MKRFLLILLLIPLTAIGLGSDRQLNYSTWLAPELSSTPANPAANHLKIYSKTDNKVYKLTSAGVETELGAGGTSSLTVVSKTTTHTALTTEDVILGDTSGGGWTLTLPTTSGNEGKVYYIRKTTTDFNALTIDPNGAETIEGASTFPLYTKNESIKIVATSSGWVAIGRSTTMPVQSVTFTGTHTTNTTYSATLVREGNRAIFEVRVAYSGAPNATTLQLSFPSGISLDTSSYPSISGNGKTIGWGQVTSAGGRFRVTALFSGSGIDARVDKVDGTYTNLGAQVSNTAPVTLANGDEITFHITMAVTNWKP